MRPIDPAKRVYLNNALGCLTGVFAYLDESGPRGLHASDKEAIPPDSTPPIAAVLSAGLAHKQHGAAYYDRDEESEEVDEALGGENGLPDPVAEQGRQAGDEGALGL